VLDQRVQGPLVIGGQVAKLRDGVACHLRNSFGAIRARTLALQGPGHDAPLEWIFDCVGFQMAGHFSMFNSARIRSGFSSLVPFSFLARSGLLALFGFVR